MNNGRVQDDLVEQFECEMQPQKQLEQQKITIRDAVN